MQLSAVLYLVAAVLAVCGLYRPRRMRWAMGLALGGWIAEALEGVLAAVRTRQLPVATMSQWMALLVWIIVAVALFSGCWQSGRLRSLAGFLLPIASAFALADLALSQTGQAGRPVSGWVLVHITLATMAVLSLLLAAVFGLMYTEKERELRRKSLEVFYYHLPGLNEMDEWSARLAAIGLTLWIFALAAGGLAADSLAKRIGLSNLSVLWASFTTVMYGVYFVLRGFFGWRGRPAAILIMALFLMVLVNFATIRLL